MNNITHSLLEGIKNYLHQTQFDLVSIRRMPDQEEYVVRIKKKRSVQEQGRFSGEVDQLMKVETIYRADGKLNIPYLMMNADLLYEAGDERTQADQESHRRL